MSHPLRLMYDFDSIPGVPLEWWPRPGEVMPRVVGALVDG